MRKRWHEWNTKQRLLAVLVIAWPLAMVVRYANIPWPELPTPGRLRAEEDRLRKRRTQLAELRAAHDDRGRTMAMLRAEAAPFWQIPGRAPEVEILSEFNRMAQAAQVQPSSTSSPREDRVMELSHVSQVTFTTRLTKVSMREVSRLFQEMERSRFPLEWTTCTIAPDNRKTPQTVNLNGQLRALVLSDRAARFLNQQPAEE